MPPNPLFDMPVWVAKLCVGIVQSLTPLSWVLCIICPPLFFTYFGLECAFSIYHARLVRQAQKLWPPPDLSQEFLRTVMLRAMGGGMQLSVDPIPADEADGEDMASNGHVTNGRPKVARTKSTGPVQAEDLAPTSMLDFDDPRAVDFRASMTRWFYHAHWSEIYRGNLRDWLAWSLFGTTYEEVVEQGHIVRESGGQLDKQTRVDFIEWAIDLVSNRAGAPLTDGHNPKVKAIRLTLDPVTVTARPLAFYLVTAAASWYVLRRVKQRGFKYGQVSKDGLEYIYRIPAGWRADDENNRPLVFVHGLGIGALCSSLRMSAC